MMYMDLVMGALSGVVSAWNALYSSIGLNHLIAGVIVLGLTFRFILSPYLSGSAIIPEFRLASRGSADGEGARKTNTSGNLESKGLKKID